MSSKAPKEMSAAAVNVEQKAPPRQDVEKTASKEADRVDDPKDPTLKAERGKPLGDKKVTATDREKAIKKFMDSFESEFGLPPTRIVEAIANLEPADLLKSPEETADAVVGQLGLDDKEEDRARAMYASLLVDLSKSPTVSPERSAVMAGAGLQFGQEFRQRMQIASDQKSMTNMHVDRLNQKFWKNPQADQAKAMNAMANPSAQALSRMQLDDSMDADSDLDNLNQQDMAAPAAIPQASRGPVELPPHLRGQLEQNATPAMIAALTAKIDQLKTAQAAQGEQSDDVAAVDGEAPAESANRKGSFESLVKKPEAQTSAGLGALFSAASGGHSSGEASTQSHSQNESQDSFTKNMNGQKENLKAGEKAQAKVNFKETMKGLQDGINPQGLAKPEALPRLETAAVAGGAAVTGQQALGGEHETANIRQLMNQAQILIKKGGGEMKVEMTPEGLGPVHLKVMVQDGKVNVQMSATTDEAKKTIETSLADLKTSLAAHKLSVDHVKVDVVNGTSTDVATNNQQNLGQGGERRGDTQKFWNQFNENFGSGSRDSFLDVTNLKGYAQPKKDPLQPVDVASKTRAVTGRGRELNLVA